LLGNPRGNTLITITIGGNDIGFSSELTRCITSFFPSGQNRRLGSYLPTRLKRGEIGCPLAPKTKAFELFALRSGRLFAYPSPLFWRYLPEVLLKLMRAFRLVFPPLIESNATHIPQEIAIPIFSPADAPIAGFESPGFSFRLIVCSGKVLAIITLSEVGSHIRENLQKRLEALLLQFAQASTAQHLRQRGAPVIEPLTNVLIVHDFSSRGPPSIEDVFRFDHPPTRACV
jgi:hypothetical protein